LTRQEVDVVDDVDNMDVVDERSMNARFILGFRL
jgi:hypothetical protein